MSKPWLGGSVDDLGFRTMVNALVDQIEDEGLRTKAIRAYALKFIEAVVPATPVDKGRARGGWTAAQTRIPQVSTLRTGPNAEQGRQESRYTEKGLNTPGAKIHAEIFNGVPYITFLELGSSRQAPSGFVRIALRELLTEMTDGEKRRVEAAIPAANEKARRVSGVRQGGPTRSTSGHINLRRR